jgi:tol-pal system protein YbgF
MRSVIAFVCLLLPLSAVADAALQAQVQRLTATVLEQERALQRLDVEVRALRGEMEVLSHQTEQFNQSGRNLYADMDTRLRRLEATPPPSLSSPSSPLSPPPASPPPSTVSSPTTPPPVAAVNDSVTQPIPTSPAHIPMPAASGDERSAYQNAFNLLQGGHYQQAVEAFQRFITEYSSGEYSDNAQYWLGESYYAMRDYRAAQNAFQRVIEGYPNSQKRAHAELKLGYVYYELKDKVRAREILEQVRLHYPDTSTARLAEERLQRLKIEGY